MPLKRTQARDMSATEKIIQIPISHEQTQIELSNLAMFNSDSQINFSKMTSCIQEGKIEKILAKNFLSEFIILRYNQKRMNSHYAKQTKMQRFRHFDIIGISKGFIEKIPGVSGLFSDASNMANNSSMSGGRPLSSSFKIT